MPSYFNMELVGQDEAFKIRQAQLAPFYYFPLHGIVVSSPKPQRRDMLSFRKTSLVIHSRNKNPSRV
jgi:hypothetical protein